MALCCNACGKGVMSNSIQCTECCEWVHRRCGDTKVPLIKVQCFRCRMCLTGHGDNEAKVFFGRMPFLTPTLLLYPGLGLAGEYQKVNPQAVEVTRVSERLMMVKLIVGKCLMNVVAAYAPQTGRSQEEKDNFWEAVWKLIEGIKKTERIMLGGDLNGHVGKESDGYEGVHGGQGYGMRNAEGERILEFCEAAGMIVCGTQFRKADSSSSLTHQVVPTLQLTT